MDNVSSQDLRFLDNPMDISRKNFDFNGYTAEQLCSDESITSPLIISITKPSVTIDIRGLDRKFPI